MSDPPPSSPIFTPNTRPVPHPSQFILAWAGTGYAALHTQWLSQCHSNCFNVRDDLKLIKELKSVLFGEISFDIDRTEYKQLLNQVLLCMG